MKQVYFFIFFLLGSVKCSGCYINTHTHTHTEDWKEENRHLSSLRPQDPKTNKAVSLWVFCFAANDGAAGLI